MFAGLKNRIRSYLLQKAYRIPRYADLYFSTDNAFQNEHYSVLRGRYLFGANREEQVSGFEYALRRNIHRIEKGLITQPRKGIFGLEYIEETINHYQAYLLLKANNSCFDLSMSEWATAVLEEYFNVTDEHEIINQSKKIFNSLQLPSIVNDSDKPAPYRRGSSQAGISYEEFATLCRRRCSTRYYLNKKVPNQLLDLAIEAAAQSPSACNRQPFVFRIYNDMELASKISSIPIGASTYAHQIPCIVVLVGQLRAFASEADRHVIYIDASLAAMSFELALETLGLSSCSINWRDDQKLNDQIASLMGLGSDEVVIMMISVGFPDPDGMIPFSQKKSLDNLRSYNEVSIGGE